MHSKTAGASRKVAFGDIPVDWANVQNKPSSLGGLGSSTKLGADFRASGAGTSGDPYVLNLSGGNSLTHVNITDASAGQFYELRLDSTPSNGQWWAVYLDNINAGVFRVKVGAATATQWNVNDAWRLWMIMGGGYRFIAEGAGVDGRQSEVFKTCSGQTAEAGDSSERGSARRSQEGVGPRALHSGLSWTNAPLFYLRG